MLIVAYKVSAAVILRRNKTPLIAKKQEPPTPDRTEYHLN
jgi:hypothetical protein